MKKLIEIDGEGLESLMGQRVTFFCINYIYTGKLTGINDTFVMLEDGGIVYETGDFSSRDWKDYQKLPDNVYVMRNAIESFIGRGKNIQYSINV